MEIDFAEVNANVATLVSCTISASAELPQVGIVARLHRQFLDALDRNLDVVEWCANRRAGPARCELHVADSTPESLAPSIEAAKRGLGWASDADGVVRIKTQEPNWAVYRGRSPQETELAITIRAVRTHRMITTVEIVVLASVRVGGCSISAPSSGVAESKFFEALRFRW